ncbi:MAG: GntR family transcriptional regulator [Victivallales bacterium]|jgi:DNA-binding LacI/PurR family transcriptional regulator
MLKNKYEILRDLIKKDIISGKYLPGMSLPTEGDFRRTYGANHGTINKAISSLSTEGFIKTKPRNGSVVLPVRERRIPSRLGIYVMRTAGHIFEKLNSEILNTLQKNYYFPLLVNLDYIIGDKNLDWLVEHLEEAVKSMPEFIVIDGQAGFPFDFLLKRHEEIENLIFVNRFECGDEIPSIKILSDYEQGGYLAANHLLDSGCRNLLVALVMREVMNDDINIDSAQRKGFKKALTDRGLDPGKLIFIARNDPDFTTKIKSIFKGAKSPDGIFADSDFTGYKIMQALDGLKIRHRRDYRLVGYFDTPWSSESASPFDSVSINQEGIASKLNEIIINKNYTRETWMIKPEIKINKEEMS